MHFLFALFLLPFGALHFLPTIVAALRRSRHTLAIFFINLFFGWTVIGWVCAMIWAVVSETRFSRRVYAGYPVAGYPHFARRF